MNVRSLGIIKCENVFSSLANKSSQRSSSFPTLLLTLSVVFFTMVEDGEWTT